MQGNNVLYLNEATMIEIVEGHLNALMKEEKIVVTTVEQNTSNDNRGMFRVVISSSEDMRETA